VAKLMRSVVPFTPSWANSSTSAAWASTFSTWTTRQAPRWEAELCAFCQGKIAHYKVPRYFQFVESFPTTVTGKVQKFVLRAKTVSELGRAEERTA
jgi:acyl-CoA synthetase (AMP-forming)/AMP-acid ligase II